MTKNEILEKLNSSSIGFFLKDDEYKPFADLNGKEARRYLTSKGFKVIKSGDVNTHGFALTSEGVYLSTNGYISLKKGRR